MTTNDPNQPTTLRHLTLRIGPVQAFLLVLAAVNIGYEVRSIITDWSSAQESVTATILARVLTNVAAAAAGWQASTVMNHLTASRDITQMGKSFVYFIAWALIAMGSQGQNISVWNILPGTATGLLLQSTWWSMLINPKELLKQDHQNPETEVDPNPPTELPEPQETQPPDESQTHG